MPLNTAKDDAQSFELQMSPGLSWEDRLKLFTRKTAQTQARLDFLEHDRATLHKQVSKKPT